MYEFSSSHWQLVIRLYRWNKSFFTIKKWNIEFPFFSKTDTYMIGIFKTDIKLGLFLDARHC